jgi:hypothetical protein
LSHNSLTKICGEDPEVEKSKLHMLNPRPELLKIDSYKNEALDAKKGTTIFE